MVYRYHITGDALIEATSITLLMTFEKKIFQTPSNASLIIDWKVYVSFYDSQLEKKIQK